MLDLFNIEYLKNNVEVIPLSTAVLALFGLLFTTVFKAVLEWRVNKAKIKADVISKSRVEWLELIRLNTAILIESYYSYMNNFTLTESGHKEMLKDLSDVQAKYNRTYWLLKLYYTEKDKKGKPNIRHNEIIEKLDTFNNKLEEFIDNNKGIYGDFDPKELDIYLEEFVEVSSKYFKDVWEETKKNK